MEPFKNLFNPALAKRVGLAILRSYPSFDNKSFLKQIGSELSSRELKERVTFIAITLHAHLPNDPKIFIPILLGSLKKNEDDAVGLFGFALWPLTHLISLYGLEDFQISLNALKEMTKLFTAEFAVRAFFIKNQNETLKIFKVWIDDEDEHVRRLVSEGSRPMLPWGQKLQAFADRPELTWPFLEKLKNDPSEYVRMSVANHINDHSKNHPDYVIEKLLKWHHFKNKTPEISWVIKHASRSLIKKGFAKAFLLHGVEASKLSIIKQKIITPKVKLGGILKVEVILENLSKKPATIILDHELHLLKANGKHSLKVFKGKKILLEAFGLIKLEMNIPLKVVTTRVYYNGIQLWNIKMNGVSELPQKFNLLLE